jgi:hypothetical protein
MMMINLLFQRSGMSKRQPGSVLAIPSRAAA